MTNTENTTKGKIKQRKPQTEEEFQAQKANFESIGPVINTQDWFLNDETLHNLQKDQKIDRKFILNSVELLYFRKEFEKCLNFIETYAESMYGINTNDEGDKTTIKKIDKDYQSIVYIKSKCTEKLHQSQQESL
ncbi:hypothetical protein DFJ63DRAFT_317040 [Scheffersomyces coipomensis]|uniref:uncharacterized protein n=1 Tax=Scheffersomyces coipomensis TaxID=1788519 RepID=UPI00315D3F5E